MGQWRTIAIGMLFGTIWMVAQAVMLAVIGLAIDQGVRIGTRAHWSSGPW